MQRVSSLIVSKEDLMIENMALGKDISEEGLVSKFLLAVCRGDELQPGDDVTFGFLQWTGAKP